MSDRNPSPPNEPTSEGATVVITHRVRSGRKPEYERWVGEIAPVCEAAPGYLDWQIIRPIPGITHTYTVIIRFDTDANLRQWMHSDTRRQLIDRVRPLLVTGDDFLIRSGLDFWFVPSEARARVPVRWKQFLVTWSAIFPLVVLVPWLTGPLLSWLGLTAVPLLPTLLTTGVVVFVMVYLLMPRYTRWISRWLFD